MNQMAAGKTFKCPVCSVKIDLSSDEMLCSNCKADLTPIRRLHELGDRYCNQALALVDKGAYDQALEKLMSALQYHDDPGTVRILAGKILHKKGRHEEAFAQWQQAADQGKPEAQELAQAARQQARKRRIKRIAVHSGAYCVLLTALVFSVHYATGLRAKSERYAGQVNVLQGRIGKVHSSFAAQEGELGDLARSLQEVQGLKVMQGSGRITIIFREGIFNDASDRPNGRSATRLKLIAQAVRRCGKPCRVEIEGFTNNVPLRSASRWQDSWTLGLARARAAADCMGCRTSDSRIKWLVASAGESSFPFPNDSPANRAKNRTVVIHITGM